LISYVRVWEEPTLHETPLAKGDPYRGKPDTDL